MDLHAWITEQVDAVERAAQKAAKCTATEWQACGSLILTIGRANGERVAGADIIEAVNYRYDDALVHAADHDPGAVLRRCEADRRVLQRHRPWPRSDYCDGCGSDLTARIGDCPELLDLAHAHGITDEILARLDRPQTPPRPAAPRMAVTPAITTDQIPAALRGPRWGHRH